MKDSAVQNSTNSTVVVCLVTWPLSEIEAGVDFLLIETYQSPV